ncbi:hypothetical protein ACFQWA_12580 [Streptomyces thermogriseus]|uniref:hypothetical protein n=1 Tax=Streptomyces thermogriseus TaxID=75292 RepID=UPI00360DAB74
MAVDEVGDRLAGDGLDGGQEAFADGGGASRTTTPEPVTTNMQSYQPMETQ